MEFEAKLTTARKYIKDIWFGSTIHPRKAGGIHFELFFPPMILRRETHL